MNPAGRREFNLGRRLINSWVPPRAAVTRLALAAIAIVLAGLLALSAFDGRPVWAQSSDATLSDLTLSDVDFGAFASGTTTYTANVYRSVSETTVTPTVNHSSATYVIKLDGTEDADGTVSLAVGDNVITVEVTAEDGSTQTYTVTVTRAVNTPATGTPKIGDPVPPPEPRVTRELEAETWPVKDADGMENVTFSYQWISNDGSTDTDIDGATGQKYTLQAADEGKFIKVQVSFTDDLNNPESLTSDPTVAVVAEDAGICTRTPIVIEELIWYADGVRDCGFVTAEHLASITGWLLMVGDLSNRIPPAPRIDSLKAGDFAGVSNLEKLIIRDTRVTELPAGLFDGLSNLRELQMYGNDFLATLYSGTFTGLRLLTDLDLHDNAIGALPDDVFDGLLVLETLDLSKNELTTLPEGVFDNLTHLEELDLRWNELSSLPEGIFDNLTDLESLSLWGNDLGSLSADLFSELDNLEWLGLFKNGLGELPDGIFSELSSLEGLGLSQNSLDELPAGVFDDLSGLKRLHLEENDLDELPDGLFAGWTSLVAVKLADNPGAPFVWNLEIAREDDDTVVVNVSNATPFDIAITLEATGGSLSSTEVTLPAGGTSTAGIDVTPDGEASVTIRVVSASFDTDHSTGIAIDRGDPFSLGDNIPATGKPTISGTAQVKQTLTASTSDIADEDGLNNVSYRYQWVSNDGSTDQDIADATSSTYTVTAAELDRTIKVLVTFEDDDGNSEAVTSAATAAVTAAPNVAATGKPAIVGSTIIGHLYTEALTVDLTGIADGNGVPDSGFSYYWICVEDGVDERCSGSPSQSTFQASRYDRGAYLKVSVRFMDEGGNWETVVSDPVGPVAYANSPARGAPLLSGTPIVGEWLSAHPHGIYDGNGTQKHRFSRKYQWFADGTAIEGATSHGYQVTSDDVGKRIHFVLHFKDDDGWHEALESPPTALVVAADSTNSPPRGAPVIRQRHSSGSTGEGHYIEVGDTLTTVTTTGYRGTNIIDPEGLTNAFFTYQWMRGDGTTFTDISDATGMNYTLQDADEGKRLKVKVAFSDDAGTQYSMISAPSSPVDAGTTPSANNPAQGNATISGTAKVGETLTVDVSGITDADGMDDPHWSFNWTDSDNYLLGIGFINTWTVEPRHVGKTLTVTWIFHDDMGYHESGSVTTAVVVATVPDEPRALAAEPGNAGELDLSWVEPDSDGGAGITGYTVQWKESADSWDTPADVSEATVTVRTYTITGLTDGTEYSVRVFATNSAGDGSASREVTTTPSNNSATGQPTISGTPKVGQTLTASTTGISDPDGPANPTFTYQWLADDVEIDGATSDSYTLQDAEEGKAITVQVSFTDDRGYRETVTSEPTTAVVPRATVPGKSREVAVEPGGEGKLKVSWKEPASDGDSAITGYKVQWKEAADDWDTDEDVSDATVTEKTHTISGLTDGVRYAVRVLATNAKGDGPPTREVKTTPGNNSATGKPTISGTAKVGETLTASTTNIADADGLTSPTFTYQWLADDVEIDEATSDSYTLVAGDAGKAIAVEVSFTDDLGYEETVTSEATSAVAPLESTKTTTTVSKTVTTESAVPTAETSPRSDTAGPGNADLIYERLAGRMLVRSSEDDRRRSFRIPRTTGSPVLFDIRHSGVEEFMMLLVDSGQFGGVYERILTPAGLSGPYEGVRALVYTNGMFEDQEEAAGAFNVRVVGDGAWEVKIGLPNFKAPPVTMAKGSGDNVVGPWDLWSPNPFVHDFHFEVTHQGSAFSARLIASDGTVRTLVPYQNAAFTDRTATVNVFAPWNPHKGADDLHYDDYVLEVRADGEWSIRLINPAPKPAARQKGIPLDRVLGTYTGLGHAELVQSIAGANLPNSPILFDIDFRGGSAFDVALQNTIANYARHLTPDDTVGSYQGVLALPYRDGELDGELVPWFNVVVEALGPWEVKIGLPDFSAPAITSADGSGDNVIGPFVLTSEDLLSSDFLFKVTHAGAEFKARLIGSDGSAHNLIPPQHIPFKNKEAPLTLYAPGVLDGDADDLSYGEYVLAVEADGEWSVELIEATTEEEFKKDDPLDG